MRKSPDEQYYNEEKADLRERRHSKETGNGKKF